MQKRLDLAIKSGNKKGEARALYDISWTLAQCNRFLEALEKAQKSYDIYQSLNHTRGMANTYATFMYVHFAMNNYEKLEEYANKLLKNAQSNRDTPNIVISLMQIAIVASDRDKDYRKSIDLNLEALRLSQITQDKDIGAIYTNIADDYASLKDWHKSLKYAQLSIEAYSETEDSLNMMTGYFQIAVAYAKLGQFAEADKALAVGSRMFATNGGDVLEAKRGFEGAYAQVAEAKGDYKTAFERFKNFYSADSALLADEHHTNLAQMETSYRTKQKEQQNEHLTSQIQFQRVIFGAASLVLILLGSLFYLQRNKLRINNKLLETQQELAREKLQNAEHELSIFTQSLREKTEALESLKAEVTIQKESEERHQWLAQLNQATLMTDQQLRDFRLKFDRVYPLFFTQLQDAVPDISESESRFAALSKLGLKGNEIAAMLGISPDSVIKMRYRFRKKLGDLDLETLLERF
jgi:hypothetical protein